MTVERSSGATGPIELTTPLAPAPARSGGTVETSASTLLPAPDALHFPSGDVGAELAKLVAESAREQKDFASKVRQSEEHAQLAAEGAELTAMRDEAEQKKLAGLVGGLSTAAAGVADLCGLGDTKLLSGIARSGKIMEGSGKAWSAAIQYEGDMAGVEAKHQSQIGDRHKRMGDDGKDMEKDADALLDKALDFYKEYTTAKADASKAALLRA